MNTDIQAATERPKRRHLASPPRLLVLGTLQMEVAQIKTILDGLTPDAWGWRAHLPTEAGMFMGLPICVDVETRPYATPESTPPPVNSEELTLLTSILTSLPTVLAAAEQRFRDSPYALHDKAILNHVVSPEITL